MTPMSPSASTKRPLVWAIGGSDSGGGAGIQADLLTLQDLGCHACTVITAITAQNSQQVCLVTPVDAVTLEAQLDALGTDLPPSLIKIGQIPATAQAEVILQWLRQHKSRFGALVIWDPVLVASSGQNLSDISAPLCRQLLEVVDILTPNWHELAAFTALSAQQLSQLHQDAQQSKDQQAEFARQLANLLPQFQGHLLLKGGHDPAATELLQDGLLAINQSPASNMYLMAPRLPTKHQHGTGCTLASALAAALARGYTLEDALVIARAYLQQGLRLSYATGQGPGVLGRGGWPDTAADFPMVRTSALHHIVQPTTPWEPLQFAKLIHPLGLYPVVDDIQWLKRLLPLGLHTIQLRLKDKTEAQLHQQISQAVAFCRDFDIQLFINDHWQLALQYQAFGVHLGQEDLASADLAAIAAAGLRLGISTHGYAELCQVLPLKPSYLALGHIFPTQTKQMPSQPQGVSRLAAYVKLCGNIPTVAIGGITVSDIPSLLQTGVQGIAVVSAITKAVDPEKALTQLKQACQRGANYGGVLYGNH